MQLVIIDEIHLLGVDRGPVLEVIVSRMRFISAQTARPIRFVGLSTALANPKDLADWLGIGKIGIYNFRSAVRPIPLTTHIQGFPGQHYCPRMVNIYHYLIIFLDSKLSHCLNTCNNLLI